MVELGIITHNDQERFSILEAMSQDCGIPITETDLSHIEHMDVMLTQLGDGAAGLAAVQIGYPKRIFLLRQDDANRAFINPQVIAHSAEMRRRPEACLSLPGLVVRTERPKELTLKYFDLEGNEHTEKFAGFWAQAVCHEMSHLDGHLLSHELQNQFDKQARRTSFGMKITEQKTKQINSRRCKNKIARKNRKKNRIGR